MAPVLFLSTTLLTDRMLRFSSLANADFPQGVVIWTNAPDREQWVGAAKGWRVEPFPQVAELPCRLQMLRRVVDYSFDFHHNNPSRQSFWKLRRAKELSRRHRLLRLLGWSVAQSGQQHRFERAVLRLIRISNRGAEIDARLDALKPGCVVAMSPFRHAEPAIVSAAERRRIPAIGFMTSWDNLSTKARLPNSYDLYLAWSARMQQELGSFLGPRAREDSRVVGSPQFDAFRDSRFVESREAFCKRHGMHPGRPIVLYCLGSPNFLKEHYGAVEFCRRVASGKLGCAQVLLRPHPVFAEAEELKALRTLHTSVFVQRSGQVSGQARRRFQDEDAILDWVSTFRHADVVVNLSSTVVVDAALFDKPIVNLDFDPEPGRPNQQLIKEVNHLWTHFKPVAESGGVWLVNDMDELVTAVRTYLKDPSLHREKRRWIAEYVCGYTDGRSGARLAEAILDFNGLARA